MWRNGGVTALILSLSTGWMQVFMLIFYIYLPRKLAVKWCIFYLIHFMICSNDGFIYVDFILYVCNKIVFKILHVNMICLPQICTLMFILRNQVSHEFG